MAIWDERYLGEDYAFGTEPNVFLSEIADKLPTSGYALDLATGEGRNAVFLAKRGLHTQGIDVSQVGLNKAQRLAQSQGVNVDFKQIDILTMTWQKAYYSVISSVFFHLREPERSHIAQNIVSALSPNGLFIGVFYHREQLGLGTGGPSDPTMLGTLSEWQAAFSGLTWLHAEHRVHVLNEGSRHCGQSAVVYLLGQKTEAKHI